MSHSWVPNVELNEDGTISLYLTVEGFDEGTVIEISGEATQLWGQTTQISGQATQAKGAVASFYSVQTVPAPGADGQGSPMEVKSVPTVNKFEPSDPITVIARAAEVWITTMEPGSTSSWTAGSDKAQAQWSSTGDGTALCPQ